MRTIGLIGGMSWESSAEYYRILNEGVREALGPTASARCLLWSFDFSEIEKLQHDGHWAALGENWPMRRHALKQQAPTCC
jgi:aspartate racemase